MRLHSVDAASSSLAELLDDLKQAETAVTIVDDGQPVALLIKPDDYDGLVETLEVMSDAELFADIQQARADYAAGRAIEGVEAARALRPGA